MNQGPIKKQISDFLGPDASEELKAHAARSMDVQDKIEATLKQMDGLQTRDVLSGLSAMLAVNLISSLKSGAVCVHTIDQILGTLCTLTQRECGNAGDLRERFPNMVHRLFGQENAGDIIDAIQSLQCSLLVGAYRSGAVDMDGVDKAVNHFTDNVMRLCAEAQPKAH